VRHASGCGQPRSSNCGPQRAAHTLLVLGRLRPRTSVAEARAAMDIIARRLEREYPQTNEARSIDVAPLRELTNSGDGVNGGDGRSKTGRPERRGPERCLWNAQGKQDFPVLDFSVSATTAPCKGENSSPEEKCNSQDQWMAAGCMLKGIRI